MNVLKKKKKKKKTSEYILCIPRITLGNYKPSCVNIKI